MIDPYAALQGYPEYRFFLIPTLLCFTTLFRIQVRGVYLYEITGDPLVLGLAFVAVPYISVTLYGGYLARYHKRIIAQVCFGIVILCSVALYLARTKRTVSNGIQR
jgi:uncharacterized membrane protein